MDTKAFNKLKLTEKIQLLKAEGNYLASRLHLTHYVYLYELQGVYVEVWKKIGLDYIEWIEIANNKETINSYLKNINLDKDLER